LQAIILAAGTGARIMPVTKFIPKALLPIANRPLLEYAVRQLERAGLREITIVTGYMGRKTTGGLENSEDHIEGDIRFVNADGYMKGPIFSLLAAEKSIQDDFLLAPVDLILAARIIPKMLTNRFEEDTVYIAVDSQDPGRRGTPVSYSRLPKSNLGSVLALGSSEITGDHEVNMKAVQGISIGIAVCPAETFKYARAAARNGATKVVDALNLFISQNGKGRCVMIGAEDYWFDVDTVETALSANRFLLKESLFGDKPKGKLFTSECTRWSGSGPPNSCVSDAKIIGPSIIGEGSEIGSGSDIGPYVSVQKDCYIGHDVNCRDSIVLEGSRINDCTSIEDTMVYGRKILSAKKSKNVTSGRDVENG
jgi:NDP-sugar pyrophosphorylase family protein